MPKSTRHPKAQQMTRVHEQARRAMARAGVLEKAYMNLTGVIVQHVQAIEEGKNPSEEIVNLMQAWQKNDAMLKNAFEKIDVM